MLAAYGACAISRIAAQVAFKSKGRSMVAGDVIAALGAAVEAVEGAQDGTLQFRPWSAEDVERVTYKRFLQMEYGC